MQEGVAFNLDQARWTYKVPTIVLAAPYFADPVKREANLADLISHETFHVSGWMVGNARAASEYWAYFVGLCSQLRTVGEISVATSPGLAIDGTPEVRASSSAAEVVRMEIAPLLGGGLIRRGSAGGAEICGRSAVALGEASR